MPRPHQINITIPPRLLEAIRYQAQAEGLPVASWIKRVITLELNRIREKELLIGLGGKG